MKIKYFFLFFSMIIFGCINTDNAGTDKETPLKLNHRKQLKCHFISAIERQCVNAGMLDVKNLDSSIIVAIQYATDTNYWGINLYGTFNKAFLQPEIADKLVKANRLLKKQNPDYSIIVFDAARPASVQQRMWDSLKIPLSQKAKFVADPVRGSLHNYGCAVDVSIVNDKGILLDMGTKFDSPERLAYPIYEEFFLASGKLSKAQVDNRKLLRDVMKSTGFTSVTTEWWHFNGTSLQNAKRRFQIIQ